MCSSSRNVPFTAWWWWWGGAAAAQRSAAITDGAQEVCRAEWEMRNESAMKGRDLGVGSAQRLSHALVGRSWGRLARPCHPCRRGGGACRPTKLAAPRQGSCDTALPLPPGQPPAATSGAGGRGSCQARAATRSEAGTHARAGQPPAARWGRGSCRAGRAVVRGGLMPGPAPAVVRGGLMPGPPPWA